MRWLKHWWHSLQRYLKSFTPPMTVLVVEEDLFPKKLPRGRVVLLNDDGPYAVGLLCPCGCGESIELMVMEGIRPRWDIQIDEFNRPTLHPSVWKKTGCCSHFWLKRGRIVWCE